MGMPKKATRKITVNQMTYRWIIRQLLPTGVHIVVQSSPKPGAVLILRSDQNIALHHVHPAEIASAIQTALARGWKPHVSGTPFELTVSFMDDLG